MSEDTEITVIQEIIAAFEKVGDEAARQRVFTYVCDRLGLVAFSNLPSSQTVAVNQNAQEDIREYKSVAELFEATNPSNGPNRAVVAGYWIQVCMRQEEFTGKDINDLLKELGHPLANVTSTFTDIMERKPQLVMQAGKVGTQKKKYKLTGAGITYVQKMIAAGPAAVDE